MRILLIIVALFMGCDNSTEPEPEDCAGVAGGNAVEDCVGVCNGSAEEDCAGVCEGTAIEDCAGACDGDAVVDECGVCSGNNSSCILIDVQDYNFIKDRYFFIDNKFK